MNTRRNVAKIHKEEISNAGNSPRGDQGSPLKEEANCHNRNLDTR